MERDAGVGAFGNRREVEYGQWGHGRHMGGGLGIASFASEPSGLVGAR
jgi:hypothetical protein